MGSASSKCRRVRLRASSGPSDTPRLPQELLDEIMDHLAGDSTSLRHCSTAARAFVPSCRRHLFSRVVFRPHNLPTWKATFPNPSTSPATYTREMRIHLVSDMPIQLPEYMPYFSNVRDLALIGGRCENYEWISTIGKLPASIRSLTMKFVSVTNSQVLEIMGQLPNLDNFSLCTFQRGDFPARMGGILKGRYSGRLELLLTGDSHASIVESLLEAPAGLAFKSMKAFCNAEDDFPVYAALVTSCQDTLTDLDISVSAEAVTIPGKNVHGFDLSRHKSLEHLSFSLLSKFASCRWLYAALSTINPANSPHLSGITIYLYRYVPPARLVSEFTVDDATMKDLRDVGTEVKRIRAESGGRVRFEVVIPLSWVMKPIRSAWPNALEDCSFRVEY